MNKIDELKLYATVHANVPGFTEVLKRQLEDRINYLIHAVEDSAVRIAQGEARALKAIIDRLESSKDSLSRIPPGR